MSKVASEWKKQEPPLAYGACVEGAEDSSCVKNYDLGNG